MNTEFEKTYDPKPSELLIRKKEEYWRLKLPLQYFQFLMEYNGGIPLKQTFYYKNHGYCVIRFLCILEHPEDNDYGWYDISVILTQIEDRLIDNEDLIGYNMIPIAELFGCDYLCLDFREDPDAPCICMWMHEESGELNPVTFKIADSFEEFIEMLE